LTRLPRVETKSRSGRARTATLAVVTMAWAAEFFAAWNLLQNDELAAIPDWRLRDTIWVAALALLFVSGALVSGRRFWLLIPLPPLVPLAVMVALDLPAHRWAPAHITTAGWIVLPILAWITTAAGALAMNLIRRVIDTAPTRGATRRRG
jgi:hypothetical protein